MIEPHIMAAMSALDLALDEMTAPHVPPPEEAKHLEIALAHLIAAFDSRDFEAGEEALWNCGSITIGGQHRGAWEITLRQTDAIADTLPKGEDREDGLRAEQGSAVTRSGNRPNLSPVSREHPHAHPSHPHTSICHCSSNSLAMASKG